jgi:hypothetical protein
MIENGPDSLQNSIGNGVKQGRVLIVKASTFRYAKISLQHGFEKKESTHAQTGSHRHRQLEK